MWRQIACSAECVKARCFSTERLECYAPRPLRKRAENKTPPNASLEKSFFGGRVYIDPAISTVISSLRSGRVLAFDVAIVCVTPDGLHVVTGSKDKTARVWNLRTGELETTLEHPGEVTDVCPLVHPDGKLVLVAASLDKVHVWPMVHPSVVGVQPSILRLSHGV